MPAARRPSIQLEKVLRASDYRSERVRWPLRRSLPPASALRSRGFLGQRRGSCGSARLVALAQLPIPFNTTRASYLRVASPGFPPTPCPAQPSPVRRKRGRELLKSGEFQSQRSRLDLNPRPSGGGDGRPADRRGLSLPPPEVRSGGGPGRTPLGCYHPLSFMGSPRPRRRAGFTPSVNLPFFCRIGTNLHDTVISTLLKCLPLNQKQTLPPNTPPENPN